MEYRFKVGYRVRFTRGYRAGQTGRVSSIDSQDDVAPYGVVLDGPEEKFAWAMESSLEPAPSDAELLVAAVAVVPGVGPDAPVTTNAAGGKQSATPYRPALLPPRAILGVAGVLAEGATKYGCDNWRAIPQRDNLDHALTHIFAHLAGDRSDDHLSHAACRLLFAMETTDAAPVKNG